MAGTKNKVKFNLKNVYYAPLTMTEENSPTWATPAPIPGAVSLSLDAEGDSNTFYADGIAYYVSTANNGYSGDLEIAMVPESFETDVLGQTKDSKQVMIETTEDQVKPFALLFQFDGDVKGTRHVLYNCTATRPSVSSQTNEESKEPVTDTLSLTASPLSDGRIKAKTTAETESADYENWFKKVYETPVAEMSTLSKKAGDK